MISDFLEKSSDLNLRQPKIESDKTTLGIEDPNLLAISFRSLELLLARF